MPISDTQMYTHKFDGVKSWFGDWIIDFQARLSADVTITVYEGRCMHLDADGEFAMGVTGNQMGMFASVGSDRPSVGNPSSSGYWYAAHAGRMNGVCANNGFEAETTEYDTAQTYLPNQFLRAIADDTNQTTGGRLTNQGGTARASATPANATAFVGLVSRPPAKTSFDQPNVLAFWMLYEPGASGL